jgi:DNA-binding transcriptional LysR family regulator
MDRFQAMRAFTKVVEMGGFAAAAREMGLSRSVVNKYVIALENELGIQLLQRSTRRVKATEMGLQYYDRAVAILGDVDEATAAVTQLHGQARGTLRVNAPMTFGFLHLSPVVADFMARHPEVRVDVVLNDRFVDPIEEGFDVTVRIAQPADREAMARFFASLSKRANLQRFFSFGQPTAQLIESFCDSSDPRKRLSLIVTRSSNNTSRIIATGNYIARDEITAEVAMAGR